MKKDHMRAEKNFYQTQNSHSFQNVVTTAESKYYTCVYHASKLYPLHAMGAQGGRGGIAPTHT
jgi:hypothetical protein